MAPLNPMFRLRNLRVRYGDHTALQSVDLDIHARRILAIMGPSGCGKSTLLQTLNRLTDLIPGCHVSGQLLLDGHDLLAPRLDTLALRRRVGMLFQRPNPFPMSILKNITFPLAEHGHRRHEARDARAEQALRDVGLWGEVKDRLHASALTLSGGQQQRLCLARALALEPDALLMDEPCASLDPRAAGTVEDLITSLRGRYTLIVVTHDLPQARRIADDAALLWNHEGHGTLLEAAPAHQLFQHPQHPTTAAWLSGART